MTEKEDSPGTSAGGAWKWLLAARKLANHGR